MMPVIQGIAAKLARGHELDPNDIEAARALIQQYGVSNAAKAIDSTIGGLRQIDAIPTPVRQQDAEEAAMNQAYGVPVRENIYAA